MTLHQLDDKPPPAARSTPIGTPVFMAPEVSHLSLYALNASVLVRSTHRHPINDCPGFGVYEQPNGVHTHDIRSSMRARVTAMNPMMSEPTHGRSACFCWSCAMAVRLMPKARLKQRLCRPCTIRRQS